MRGRSGEEGRKEDEVKESEEKRGKESEGKRGNENGDDWRTRK